MKNDFYLSSSLPKRGSKSTAATKSGRNLSASPLDVESNPSKAAALATAKKRKSIFNSTKHRTTLIKALAANDNNKNRCASKARNFIKSQDVFGERVEFTFKGKRSY